MMSGAGPTTGTQSVVRCWLQSNGIKLGPAQRRRLEWLAARYGAPYMQTGTENSTTASGIVVVAEPPSGARVELLCRALHAGCVVAIPFGENPAFDFLKSRLTEFGTVGPCGADGPHELWWGGIAWPAAGLSDNPSAAPPRIISCYPRATDEIAALRLRRTLASFQLDFDVQPIATKAGDRIDCVEKVDFVHGMWRRYRQPLLFVEVDAVLRQPPLLLSGLDCDVAVHKWNRWEMSARSLYLGTSDATETLLRTWQHLAACYPGIWEGYLLDQAWSLVSSQMPLDTVWLPRSYHALTGEFAARQATIIHNLPATTGDLGPDPDFAANVRVSRRAGRTGAWDSFIVLKSPTMSERSVAVILRGIESRDARAVAASIEALTSAFAGDCGGYGQLELSLCAWQDDVRIAREAATLAQCRVLEIAVGQMINPDIFRSLARREALQSRLAQREVVDSPGVAMNDHNGRYVLTESPFGEPIKPC